MEVLFHQMERGIYHQRPWCSAWGKTSFENLTCLCYSDLDSLKEFREGEKLRTFIFEYINRRNTAPLGGLALWLQEEPKKVALELPGPQNVRTSWSEAQSTGGWNPCPMKKHMDGMCKGPGSAVAQ